MYEFVQHQEIGDVPHSKIRIAVRFVCSVSLSRLRQC
jgi:hypothetical protein